MRRHVPAAPFLSRRDALRLGAAAGGLLLPRAAAAQDRAAAARGEGKVVLFSGQSADFLAG